MSYVTIYVVEKDGDVVEFNTARNNHGFAPLVWETLCKQQRLDIGAYIFSAQGDRALKELWQMCGTGKLAPEDDILLGATFDRVWIAREHVPTLVAACRAFHKKHVEGRYVDTIERTAGVLEEIWEEFPDALGVAFNMCSAVESFWDVHIQEEGVEDWRPYNVLTDTEKGGKRHWKLEPKKGGWGG